MLYFFNKAEYNRKKNKLVSSNIYNSIRIKSSTDMLPGKKSLLQYAKLQPERLLFVPGKSSSL